MEANESDMTSDNKVVLFSKSQKVIVDHLKRKNDSEDRLLHLIPDKYQFPDEGFIFCGMEGRTTRRQIAYCIEKACSKAGMPVKSAHDIRRTVASLLHKNDVALDEIRRILGHKDKKTTLGYIFNQETEETTKKMIDQALSRRNQVYSNQE